MCPSAVSKTDSKRPRRPYNSELRRQQVVETRERILAAGSELVHGFSSWDWRDLTVRAVARGAGVNERTVYRHFSSERQLHEAVMHHLEEEAAAPLRELKLDDLPTFTARVFAYLSSFVVAPQTLTDPTFVAVDQRRRDALRAAVEPTTATWSEDDRRTAAALLDVLWSATSYQRLTSVWGLGPEQASGAITGVIRLMTDAISEGHRPWVKT